MGMFGKNKKDLIKRENAAQAKEERLNNKEDLLNQRTAEFEAYKTNENEAIKKEFSKLNSDKTAFEQKRTEYEPKFQKMQNEFADEYAKTEADIQKMISETAEKNLARQKEFAEKLSAEHQQAEKKHEELLAEQTKKRIAETDAELIERRNELAEKEKQLRENEIEFQNKREKFSQDEKDLNQKQVLLNAEKQIYLDKAATLKNQAEELAASEKQKWEDSYNALKDDYARLSKERADLESQLTATNEIKSRLNGQDPSEILVKIQTLSAELAEKKQLLKSYPDNVVEELNEKNQLIDSLKDQLDDVKSKLLQNQKLANTSELNEVKNVVLESEINELTSAKERLELENSEQARVIRQFRELYDKKTTKEEKLKSIMIPHEDFTPDKIRKYPLEIIVKTDKECGNQEESPVESPVSEQVENNSAASAENQINENNEPQVNLQSEENVESQNEPQTETPQKPAEDVYQNDELVWLEGISNKIQEYGLVFPKRILYAFHTALKTAEWSPLAVLAGVSGTGKSVLPELYAKFGGLNFVNIPVQPNWDSQESLLGYYNTISGEFEAQPLLKYLVQTQTPNSDGREATEDEAAAEPYKASLKNQMNIVLLDEMNLAHIEQYFAEFLSKLEERRGKEEDSNSYPKLSVKLGGTDSYYLPLGRNVLWVGTMNQDETTKSLSDKVLDRGIVINFPRPTQFKRRNKVKKDVAEEEKYLPVETWKSWQLEFTEEQIAQTGKIIEPYKKLVEDINTEISKVGRALGHRVWQSIENYIWNYPEVRKLLIAENSNLDDEEFQKELCKQIDPAFEDQLVQKIMPKLRGIETRSTSKTILGNINELIGKFKSENHNINIQKDFENAMKFGDGQFLWVTSEYLNKETDNQ